MGKQQTNTGKGFQTVNTNSVWDRIVGVESKLAEKAKKTRVYLEDYKNGGNTWDDALTVAIAALPANEYTTLLLDTSIFGGGEVVFPFAQKLTFNNTISLRPRVILNLNSCMIISHAPSIIALTDDYGHYNRDDVIIKNGTLNGENLAGVGIDFTLATHCEINNVQIIKCTGNGIEFRDSQWCRVILTEIYNCGGYGVFLGKKISGGLRSNNNYFERVKCENNTLGGLWHQQGHVNEFNSCTFQFSAGYGVLIDGVDIIAPLLQNCHFEDNKNHLYVKGSGSENVAIENCYFASNNSYTEKWIVNEGYKTLISNARFNGSVVANNRYIVQSKTLGQMAYIGFLHDDIYFDDNTKADQSTTVMGMNKVTIIDFNYGINFHGSLSYSNYSQNDGVNYLQIGGSRIWLDSSRNFRVKNASNPTSDTDGTVFIPPMSGTTAQRPSSPVPFQPFYDKTLQKAIWFNNDSGTWKDAMGTNV